MAWVSQQSSNSAAPPETHVDKLFLVLPSRQVTPAAPAGNPPVLPSSSNPQASNGGSDILAVLAEQLANAQRTLSEQHQSTLCTLARHIGTSMSDNYIVDDHCSESSKPAAPFRPKTIDTISASLTEERSDQAAVVPIAPPLSEEAQAYSSSPILEPLPDSSKQDDSDPLRPGALACTSKPGIEQHANTPGQVTEIHDHVSSLPLSTWSTPRAEKQPTDTTGQIVEFRDPTSSTATSTWSTPRAQKSNARGVTTNRTDRSVADRAGKPIFEVQPAYAEDRKKSIMEEEVSFHTLSSDMMQTQNRASKVNANIKRLEADSQVRQKTFETTSCFRHMMLSPGGGRRLAWDLMSVVLVMYDMIVIPLSYLFDDGYTTDFLDGMIWLTRCFWTGDLVMSMISGYVDQEGSIEMRPWLVFKKYLRTWLSLDIVVVGSDWFEAIVSHLQKTSGQESELGILRVGKMGKFFRILRMLRLLRLAKVGEIINVLMERLPSETLVIFFDIVKLVIVMVSTSHFIACLWFAVGCIDYDENDPRRSNWVDHYGYDKEELEFKYLMSLRWALSQYAGGMDEITPVSLEEHLFSAFVFIGSFWAGTVILSILTSHMTQLYLMGSQQQQQINLMRRYLRQHGVSKGLTMRVQRNAQHTMVLQSKEMPESQVGLDDLVSEPLRMELHFEMYSPTLTRHPWFSSFAGECPHVARQVCHSAMKASFVAKADTLFNAGEKAHSMMFCKKGEMEYTWGMENEALIDPGKWLSEPALWTTWLHRGILVSSLDSQVFYLAAKGFEDIVTSFRWMKLHPSGYANEFVNKLNELPFEDLSDLPFADQLRQRRSILAGNLLLTGPMKAIPDAAVNMFRGTADNS